MPNEVKDPEGSVPAGGDEDARTVQNAILGKEEKSETSEKTGGETEEKAEGEKPEAKEETKAKEEKAAEEKPAEVDEAAEIEKILKSRFKGDPKEAVKAYRNLEKMQGEHTEELGKLRKEVLDWRQFKKDWEADPEGTLKQLSESAQVQKGEAENIIEKALEDPKALDRYIERKISDKESERELREKEIERMKGLYPGWDDRQKQRATLLEAINLGKFPLPDEILDMAVRGAGSPEKLLADAKKAVKEEQDEALANKMKEQVETQAGGEREKPEPSDQDIIAGEILTEEEKARA